LVSDTSPSMVDAHEDNSSVSNREIINALTPEKHANTSSKTVAVSTIKSIDWDKEIQMKREEWKKMIQEDALSDISTLRSEFLCEVRKKLEANDESYEEWMNEDRCNAQRARRVR